MLSSKNEQTIKITPSIVRTHRPYQDAGQPVHLQNIARYWLVWDRTTKKVIVSFYFLFSFGFHLTVTSYNICGNGTPVDEVCWHKRVETRKESQHVFSTHAVNTTCCQHTHSARVVNTLTQHLLSGYTIRTTRRNGYSPRVSPLKPSRGHRGTMSKDSSSPIGLFPTTYPGVKLKL